MQVGPAHGNSKRTCLVLIRASRIELFARWLDMRHRRQIQVGLERFELSTYGRIFRNSTGIFTGHSNPDLSVCLQTNPDFHSYLATPNLYRHRMRFFWIRTPMAKGQQLRSRPVLSHAHISCLKFHNVSSEGPFPPSAGGPA